MNLLEYEGKEQLRRFGIPTPESVLLTGDQAPAPLPYPFVLKAQVMTGGRGKAGGVRVCEDEQSYRQLSGEILHMEIRGCPVYGLLAEEMVKTEKEFYLSITQQGVERPTLIFSPRGGMDIEAVAANEPEQVYKLEIDPFTRLKAYQKKFLASMMGVETQQAVEFLEKLERAFFDGGALLVEINPLGIADGRLIAMDCKFVLDDHARGAGALAEQLEQRRQKLYQYKSPEREATTVTYVPLRGDVGMISDGAGTGMLTLDLLTDMGLKVASFAELGGMTTEEVMYRALELTLEGHPNIKALIIVLIGGFNRMDNMARGITRYVAEHQVTIPIFTRMCGTMEEEGLRIMQEAGLPTYSDLTQTVRCLRAAVKEEPCRF